MPRAARTRLLVCLLAVTAGTSGLALGAEPTPSPDASGGAALAAPATPSGDGASPSTEASLGPDSLPVVSGRARARPPRGPFNVRRFDLRHVAIDELSWTGEPPPPLPPDGTTDRVGVPVFRWRDGKHYYRPGALAIGGMKRIDAYRETGDRRHLRQARLQAAKLRELALHERGAVWLPFWFDYPPARLEAPWFNAMSQGLALSFFVRLHEITRDPADRATADRLFRSFLLLGPRRNAWVAFTDRDGYLWLEHYPNGLQDHHLNAHLHAVFGLYEYWRATRAPIARMMLEGAITTARDRAARYRRKGRPSFYSSRTRTVIADYHDIHVWQLRLLGELTRDPFFTRLGDDLAIDHPPKRYAPGRPAVDDQRVGVPQPSSGQRLGLFPPTGPWSETHA